MNFGELMSQAKEAGGGFTVIPAGIYLTKCIESEYRASSAGKPQIKTRWEVIEGPQTGEKGLWNYFTLSTDNPKAVAIFLRHMKALGFDDEFFNQMQGYSPEDVVKRIASMLEGRVAQLKIKVGEYNGEPKNEVDNIAVAPPGAGSVAAPPADPFLSAQAAPPSVAGSPGIESDSPQPPSTPF